MGCRSCGSSKAKKTSAQLKESHPMTIAKKLSANPQTLDLGVEGAVNPYLVAQAIDDPDPVSGGHHRYTISYKRTNSPGVSVMAINFQDGALKEPGVGINGVTNEALLAVVAHRLESFQNGQFADEYNQSALEHINAALDALSSRTSDRLERGVEGLHKK